MNDWLLTLDVRTDGETTTPAPSVPADALPLGLAMATGDGRLLQVNAGFRRLFGDSIPHGSDALRGLMLAAGVSAPEDLLAASFTEPQDLVLCRGGCERPVRLTSRRTDTGSCLHLLNDLCDDEDLQARRAELQSLIAHDLRSPLAVIQGYAGLLATGQPGPLNATQSEFLAGIDTKIVEVTRLLDDFLDLSRLEAGALKLQLQTVRLGELVDQVCKEYRRSALARQITISQQTTPPDLELEADPLRLKQILDNLLGNAIKYNHQGGWVAVTAVSEGGEVAIEVADGGPGLSANDHERLFEPFGRGGAGESVAGSGLGLVVVRRLVALHGGSITADGSPGAGTTFLVRLPLRGTADHPVQ